MLEEEDLLAGRGVIEEAHFSCMLVKGNISYALVQAMGKCTIVGNK